MNSVLIFYEEIEEAKDVLRGINGKWEEGNEEIRKEIEGLSEENHVLKVPLMIKTKYYSAELFFALSKFPHEEKEEKLDSNLVDRQFDFIIFLLQSVETLKSQIIHQLDSLHSQSESKLVISYEVNKYNQGENFIETIEKTWKDKKDLLKNEDFYRIIEVIECTQWSQNNSSKEKPLDLLESLIKQHPKVFNFL